ncbi:alpha/beta hydrolase [Kribbella sp. NPDC050124]|uniref:alpha/beta hydrolase n=1 Tax=Kribbella sp. NPDC050124 TaxID=3364114 RepID=UPI00379D7144
MPYLDDTDAVYFRHWAAAPAVASVLLLHGFGEHSGHYHRLAFALSNRGMNVWGLDHLGHGLSAGERGLFQTVDALADNAALLLDRIEADDPSRPVFVVGHSLGGIVAGLLAVRGRKTAGLVLTGAPLDGLPANVPDEAIMSQDQFYLDALATDPLGFDTAPAEGPLWRAIGVCSAELRAGWEQIGVPVLFVNGDRDVFAPASTARAWASRLPNATVVSVAGFHDIVNDLSHAHVAEQIGSFIVQHSTSPAPLTTTS